MSNKIKTFGIVAMLLLALCGAIVSANATLDSLGLQVNEVKVNGDSLNANQTIQTQIDKDSTMDVKVLLQTDGSTTVNNVEVTAFITGYKQDISETTKPFDVAPNTIYTKTLTLTLPQGMDSTKYQLRVIVSSPNSNTISYVYPLTIAAVDHSIAIKDVVLSPNDKVVAGRAFTAFARLKNYGKDDENNVKVVVSVPELGVQQTDYIDTINKDDTVSSSEMLLRIPADTKSGTYDVDVTVYYNDGDDQTKASYTLDVIGDNQAAQAETGAATGKTTITIGPQTQTMARGENGVVYPITIANGANTAKTYTLAVSGTDGWATVKVSPSNVIVLNAGETQSAYVYVAANENTAVGEHVFSVDVKAGNDVVQSIPLKADVLENANTSAWDGVKKALTVGIVLLVVLIIVLGIVILYQKKFKGSNKENSEEIAQTYY